jgi:site-specific recombinase XerD
MPRATPGDGSFYKRPDGTIRWRGPMPQLDGTTRRVDRIGPSRKALKERIAAARAAVLAERQRLSERHGAIDPYSMTVATYCRWWLETVVKTTKTAATYNAYDLQLSRIMPFIGDRTVAALRKPHIQAAVRSMTETKQWSAATIQRSVQVLRNAYNYLIDDEIVARNPTKGVELPVAETYEPTILTPEQIERIEQAAHNTPYEPAVYLITRMGFRLSEALGCRCQDIDTEQGVIHVRTVVTEGRDGIQIGPAKGRKGKRHDSVPYPAMLEPLLREWRARAKAMQLEHDDPIWRELDLLTPSTAGTAVWPTNFSRWWRDTLMPLAGLPRAIKRHDLRHTLATLLLRDGEDPTTVQAILRHSDIRTTLTYYSHSGRVQQQDAMDRHSERLRKRG